MGYVCAESEALVRPGTGLADSTGKGGGEGERDMAAGGWLISMLPLDMHGDGWR